MSPERGKSERSTLTPSRFTVYSPVVNASPDLDADRHDATDVHDVLSRLSAQTAVEVVRVNGFDIEVFPGVLSPRFSHSCDLLIANWRIPIGGRVLDLGSGTGVLGIFALASGAASLVAVDCNPLAVDNTRRNLDRLGFAERSVVCVSEGYAQLQSDQRFDAILLNAPYWNRHANTLTERAFFDENYRFLCEAIIGARDRLNVGGNLFLAFSDQGDTTLLAQLIERSGLHISRFLLLRPTIPGGHIRLFYELRN